MKKLFGKEKKTIKRLMCLLLMITLIAPSILTEAVRNTQVTAETVDEKDKPLAERTYPDDISNSKIDLRDMFIVPETGASGVYNAAEILEQRNILQLTHKPELYDEEEYKAITQGYEEIGVGYYAYRVSLEEDFSIEAKIFLGDDIQENGGGYGLTFVLHNEEVTSHGLGGGGLGVGSNSHDTKLYKGLVVEFDTHLEVDTSSQDRTDYGQDYDIARKYYEDTGKELTPSNHLMHTAIQALGTNSSASYDGRTGIGDYNGTKEKSANWHQATTILTIDEADEENLFGEWLDIKIEWEVDESGGSKEHILSYSLWDASQDMAVDTPRASSSVKIEEAFDPLGGLAGQWGVNVLDALFKDSNGFSGMGGDEVSYAYWGFTASNSQYLTGTPKTDDNSNEQAIALIKTPSEAEAYATKLVRKVEEQEDDNTEKKFSGSTTAEVGDIVEYEIEIKLDGETDIPLALASYYDTIESGHKMLPNTIEIDKFRTGKEPQYYKTIDDSITKGEDSDGGSITYYLDDGKTVDQDPQVLTPKYIYDTETGDFQVYGLGTLGAYDREVVDDKGIKYDPDEKIIIRFQAEVTSAGQENDTIYNKGYVEARTAEEPIYTNEHLLTDDGSGLDKEKLEFYGIDTDIDLTNSGQTQIYVHPQIELEKTIEELEDENDPGRLLYEGDTVTYNLNISNSGGKWCDGVITDVLPDGFTFDGDISDVTLYQLVDGVEEEVPFDGTITYNSDTRTIEVSDLELKYGSYCIIRLEGTIDYGTAGSEIENRADALGKSWKESDKLFTSYDTAHLDVSYRPGILEIQKKALTYTRNEEEPEDIVEKDNKKIVRVDDTVKYQVILKNDSENINGSLVRDAVIVDSLPDEVEYIPDSGEVTFLNKNGEVVEESPGKPIVEKAKYDQGNHQIITEAVDLFDDESIVLTYEVSITDDAIDELPNEVSAIGMEPYSNTLIDEVKANETLTVNPDITINKIDGTEYGAVFSGGTIEYKIIVENAQGGGLWKGSIYDELSDAALIDWPTGNALDYELNYYSVADPDTPLDTVTDTVVVDTTTDPDIGAFEISGIELRSGQWVELTYKIKTLLLPDGEPYVTIINEAEAINEDGTSKGDDSRTQVVPTAGDLKLVKDVFEYDASAADGKAGSSIDGSSVRVGDKLLYQITVTNPAETDKDTIVRNIVITDVLPDGVDFEYIFNVDGNDATGAYTYDADTKTLSYTHDSLWDGEQFVITFVVSVNSEASGTLTNTALGTAKVPTEPENPEDPDYPEHEADLDPSPDPSSVENTAAPEVSITKTVDETNVYQGEEITYTITLTNEAGAGKWTGKLTDQLPEGTSYVRSSITHSSESGMPEDAESLWKYDSDGNYIFEDANITLRSGESYTLVFTVKAEQKGTVTNQAFATGVDEDKKEDNDPGASDKIETEVLIRQGTLGIEKKVFDENEADIENAVVAEDDDLYYTVRVYNAHEEDKPEDERTDSELTDIVIKDILPAGVNYSDIKAEDVVLVDDEGQSVKATVTITDREIEIVVDKDYVLGTGKGISFSLKVTADNPSGLPITNRARVRAEVPEDTIAGAGEGIRYDRARVTNYYAPDISLEKGVKELQKDPDKVFYEGDASTYILKVTNKGGIWAVGEITDTVPQGFSFDKADTSTWSITYYDADDLPISKTTSPVLDYVNGVIKISDLELDHGEYVLAEIKGVLEPGTAGKELTNSAEATGVSPYDSGVASKDSDTADLKVAYNEGTLEIEKKAISYNRDGTSSDINTNDDKYLQVGDEVTYQVTVTNPHTDGSIVNNVVITDTLPQDVEYLSGSAKAGSADVGVDIDSTAGIITTKPVSLGDGESITLTYTVGVLKTATGELINTASAAGKVPKSDKELETDPVKETISIDPLISVSKDDGTNGAGVVVSEEEIAYTLTVSNAEGGGQWEGQITDTISSDLTGWPVDGTEIAYKMYLYENAADTNPVETDGTAEIQNGTFIIDGITLQSGQKVVITYTLTLTLPQDVSSAIIINSVKATDDTGQTEYGEDETETTVVPGAAQPDVSIKKAVNTETAYLGDDIIYTITVSNADGAGTYEGTLVDQIPDELEIESIVGGVDNAREDLSEYLNGNMLEMDIQLLGGEELVIIITTKAAAAGTGVVNTVLITDQEGQEDQADSEETDIYKGGELDIVKAVYSADASYPFEDSADLDGEVVQTTDTLQYAITISNSVSDSRADLSGLMFRDELDKNLNYVTGSDIIYVNGQKTDLKLEGSGENLSFALENAFSAGYMSADDEIVIVFQVTISAAASGAITNVAAVEGGRAEVENEVAYDLSVSKEIVGDQNVIQVGDELSYQIKVANAYSAGYYKGTLRDEISSQLEVLSVTYQKGTETAIDITSSVDADNVLTYEIELSGGEEGVILITTKALEPTQESIINKVVVTDEYGRSEEDESDEAIINGASDAAISIVKKVDKAEVEVGEAITYTIEVTNAEDAGVWSGVIRDALPDGAAYVSHEVAASGSVSVTGSRYQDGVLYADVTGMEAQDKVSITMVVTATDEKLGLGTGSGIRNVAEANGMDAQGNSHGALSGIVETLVVHGEGTLKVDKYVYSTEAAYPFGEDQAVYDLDGEVIKTTDTLRYVIALSNTEEYGRVDLSGLTFKDELDAYLRFTTGSFRVNNEVTAATVNGQTLTYDFADMAVAGDDVVLIAFDVTVSEEAIGEITNAAQVDGILSGMVSNTVASDLTVSKHIGDGQEEIYVGDELTYTIRIANAEGAGIYRGTLIDEIPEELTVTRITGGIAGQSDDLTGYLDRDTNTLTMAIELRGGEEFVLVIETTADQAVVGSISNTVVVTDDQSGETESGQSEDTVVNDHADSDISVTKAVDAEEVEVGDKITYTIKVSNASDATDSWSGTLSDLLPAGAAYQSHSIATEGRVAAAGEYKDDELLVSITDLDPGDTVTITFTVTATDQKLGLGAGEGIRNSAIATGTDSSNQLQSRRSNEVETLVVYRAGELKVAKSVYSTEAVYPFGEEAEAYDLADTAIKTSDTLRYVIRLSSAADYSKVELSDYTFVDELDQYLAYVDGSFMVNGTAVTPAIADQVLTYQLDGQLSGDDVVIIAFDVTVSEEARGAITNVAMVETETELAGRDEVNNDAPYDISLTKEYAAGQDQIEVGDELTYTIRMRNATAAGVYSGTLRDQIPAELEVQSIVGGIDGAMDDLSGSLSGNTLEMDVELRGGEELVIVINAVARTATNGSIKNTVVVTDGNDHEERADSGETVISDPDKSSEPDEPAVTLSKEVDPEIAPPGETITYVITVENTGTGTWYGEIEDDMPEELENYEAEIATIGGAAYGFAGFGAGSRADHVYSVDEIVLGEGDAIIITITADIREDVEIGTLVTNTAAGTGVDAMGNSHDPEDAEAAAVVLVKYREGALAVAKEITAINADAAADPEAVRAEPGDVIEYTIKAGNDGEAGSLLRDMVIVDTLPDGLVLLADTIDVRDADGNPLTAAEIAVDDAVVTIEMPGLELKAGEYIYVTMQTLVTAGASEELLNVVTVDAQAYDPADPDIGKAVSLSASSAAGVAVNETPDPDEKGTYEVRYYYDGILDSAKTETYTVELGSTITGFTDKPVDGYYIDYVEGLPLTVAKDSTVNIIHVYYVSQTAVPVYEYRIEYYYDEVRNEDYTVTGTAPAGTVIDSYPPRQVSGYAFDRVEGLPLTLSATGENVMRVYYVSDPNDTRVTVEYTIEYYYDGIRNDAYTITGSGEAGEVIDSYALREVQGYQLASVENLPLTLTAGAENIIRVYYETVPDDRQEYTTEYYFDGVLDAALTETYTAPTGTVIHYYLDKIKTGYVLDRTEGLPLTVSAGGSNLIKVYYKSIPVDPAEQANYYILYYYDEVLDSSLSEVLSAEVGATIESYLDKPKDGFELKEVKNLPLIVDADDSKNIIEVFYVSEEEEVIVTDPESDSKPQGETTKETTESDLESDSKPQGETRTAAIVSDPESDSKMKQKSNVQTGDYSSFAGYGAALLLALLAAISTRKRRRRKIG